MEKQWFVVVTYFDGEWYKRHYNIWCEWTESASDEACDLFKQEFGYDIDSSHLFADVNEVVSAVKR